MKWNKFRLKTTTEAEDIVSSMLMDLGVQGIEIEDKIPMTQAEKEQMFVDILPETGINDGIAYISFYLEEDEDKESLLEAVKNELEDMRAYVEVGEGTIEESQTEDVDWVNNWKKYFHQFYVDDILIIPSWEEVKPEDEGKMIVHIDPGTAFGTGMHETTQLCIRPQICDREHQNSGCRMRKWNSWNAGADVRCKVFCRNRPGSVCD